MRQQELNVMAGFGGFIDPGKRERKAIATYSETNPRPVNEEADKRQKLPRHLRLNKMEDWQFFNKARLNELQAEEVRLFDLVVERGEAPQSGMIGKFVVLSPELHEEKTQLQAEGFGDWTRVHFNNFIRASAKHGRSEYEKIAKDVGRPVEETQRYSSVFWSRGGSELPPLEWDRVTKQIEKVVHFIVRKESSQQLMPFMLITQGEKRLEEITRLTNATAKLISMFEDPWEELTFKNVGNQGRVFNAIEDRFLLCLTHLHGYGNWDQVRCSVRRCERFRFDFYLQSCSAEVLGKRCETLMRSAERELVEIERKRQIGGDDALNKSKASGELVRQRLAEITQQIQEESRRLANTRSQLQKLKSLGGSNTVLGTGTGVTVNAISGATSSAGIMKAFLGAGKSESKKSSDPSTRVGATAMTIPDSALPDLCRIVSSAGSDGINKVVNTFMAMQGNVSKRQIEIKINEIAVKEKRPEDYYIVWHLRDEYAKYLKMTGEQAAAAIASETANKKRKATDASPSADTSTKELASKSTTKGGAAEPKSASKDGGAQQKQKLDDGGPSSALKEPKRFKTAFGFFVKVMREKAEKQLGPNAEVCRW